MTEKFCPGCEETKDISNFFKNASKKDGLQTYCKICHNKDKSILRYGISKEEYNALLKEQKGVCFICHHDNGNRRLDIDHNHETGEVRGLLCHECNVALGLIYDNIEYAKRMVEYLERPISPCLMNPPVVQLNGKGGVPQ